MRLAFAASTAALATCLTVTQASASADQFERLVSVLQDGFDLAALRLEEDALPPLLSVDLEIAVEVSQAMDGGFDLYFFRLGGSTEQARHSTITLSYGPIASPDSVPTSGEATAIADAIVNAAAAARAANAIGDVLGLREVRVALSFVVTEGADGGFEIAFPPFAMSAGTSLNTANTNRIAIVFGEP